MRVRHYQLAAQGKLQEAMQEAQSLYSYAEGQIKNALDDVDGAIQYVLSEENQHPNRIDICKAKGALPGQSKAGSHNQHTSSFGQSSAPSNFGQPAGPSKDTLGFSNTASPSFGQPSFGQQSSVQTSFGQPSAFIKPGPTLAQSSPAFGQPTNAPSAFGQPSTLGKVLHNPQMDPNQFQQSSTFVQNASPAIGSARDSPGSSARNPLTQPHGPVDSNVAVAANPFSIKPPQFLQNQSRMSTAGSNPFATTASTQSNGSIGPQPLEPVALSQGSAMQLQKDSQGRLRSWNGKGVSYFDDLPCYRGTDGNWHRIWFAEGQPLFVNSGNLPDNVYDDSVKSTYEFFNHNGTFKDGIVPIIPPRKEWCSWDM